MNELTLDPNRALVQVDGLTQAVNTFAATLTEVKPIENLDQYELYARERRAVKDKLKEIETERKAITGPLDALKSAIMEKVKAATAILDKAEKERLAVLRDWDMAREAEQKAAQAALEAKIREREAELALRRGDEASAEKILAGDVAVAVPQLKEAAPLPGTGVHYRSVWNAVITDFPVFAEWCVQEKRYELLLPNMKGLEALAKMRRAISDDKPTPPPGVEWIETKVMVQR